MIVANRIEMDLGVVVQIAEFLPPPPLLLDFIVPAPLRIDREVLSLDKMQVYNEQFEVQFQQVVSL